MAYPEGEGNGRVECNRHLEGMKVCRRKFFSADDRGKRGATWGGGGDSKRIQDGRIDSFLKDRRAAYPGNNILQKTEK